MHFHEKIKEAMGFFKDIPPAMIREIVPGDGDAWDNVMKIHKTLTNNNLCEGDSQMGRHCH